MARKWWTLLAVSVATFMLLLDITVVNTALPSIEQDLGASFTDLQWVIDAYALSLAALVLIAGSLAHRLRSGGPCSRPDLPQRLSRDPGRGRCRDVRGLVGADRAGVPRRPRARHGDGRVRRDDRGGRGDRAPRGRRAHGRSRLGVGLLPERPDRDSGDRGDLCQAA